MKQFFIAILACLLLAGLIRGQEITPISKLDDIKSIMDANKGKVVLLNFWATWCKPCVKEFPDLVKLQKNYKDKGFALVFISADVPEEIKSKVVPFLDKQGVDFSTYYNNFNNPEDLINYVDKDWQGAIPSTYIYDKGGNIKASILGTKSYEEFETEINKYLN